MLLIAELDRDIDELKRIMPQNIRATERITAGARDAIDYGALGYTISRLYGLVENYFLRVSKFFENSLPGERWHKSLIERMALDIEGLRPAFFDTKEPMLECLEILKFRHRFRNLYGEDLDPIKTGEVQAIAEVFFPRFIEQHESFKLKLQKIISIL